MYEQLQFDDIVKITKNHLCHIVDMIDKNSYYIVAGYKTLSTTEQAIQSVFYNSLLSTIPVQNSLSINVIDALIDDDEFNKCFNYYSDKCNCNFIKLLLQYQETLIRISNKQNGSDFDSIKQNILWN